MKNFCAILSLSVGIFIVNESMLCTPQGPSYSDGTLRTFTEVVCLSMPFTDKSLKCLEDELVDLEKVYPNLEF